MPPRGPKFTPKYTLVRHEAYYRDHPEFAQAVVTLIIRTRKDADLVTNLGGMLFEDYLTAEHAAERENYQNGKVDGIFPCVAGTFSHVLFNGQQLYLPRANPIFADIRILVEHVDTQPVKDGALFQAVERVKAWLDTREQE